MDLMTAATSYSTLKHKYYGFAAPSAHITVDGVEITDKLGAKVGNLSMELSNGYAASSCSFEVLGDYDPAGAAFDSGGAYARLQLGARVDVALGYVVTETVFVGLVAEVEYVLEEEGFYYRVTCLDAKFLMMKNQRMEVHTGKKLSEEMAELLSGQPLASYITGKSIQDSGRTEEEVFLAATDDYAIAVRQARQLGFEFFVLAGKVYFRKPPASASVIMELRPAAGLLETRLSLRAAPLYKTAEILGINPDDGQALRAQAAIQGKFSRGSTAARMLGDSKKSVFLRTVRDSSEATGRAGALITQARGEFGRLYARCVGIPELVPGRSVKIAGVLPEADATCYILDVNHTVDEDGFHTTFEARVETL